MTSSPATCVRRDGDVWLEVEAYSRPARAWVRVLGLLVPVAQHVDVRLLAHAARRLHRRRLSSPTS